MEDRAFEPRWAGGRIAFPNGRGWNSNSKTPITRKKCQATSRDVTNLPWGGYPVLCSRSGDFRNGEEVIVWVEVEEVKVETKWRRTNSRRDDGMKGKKRSQQHPLLQENRPIRQICGALKRWTVVATPRAPVWCSVLGWHLSRPSAQLVEWGWAREIRGVAGGKETGLYQQLSAISQKPLGSSP